jgi:hypothetical protein
MSMFDLEKLLNAIRWQESRGDQSAVSPAGARTAYGIMPDTARQPGFGVQPQDIGMLSGNEDASRDFSRDYLQAMLKRYGGDVKKALGAYNAGPGNMDKGRYPQETQAYIPSVLNRYDQEGETSPSERERFDQVASKLGSAPDMTADVNAPLPEPVQTGSMGSDFLQGQLGEKPEAPMSIAPSASGDNLPDDPDEPPVQQADAGGGGFINKIFPGDEETSKMGLFERMRQPGNRQAFFRAGAGIAGNAHKGWGQGIGAGFEGAADALDRQEALDVTRRRTDLAEMGPRVAFGALYQHYKGKNDPDALNKAMIGAYAPESGKFAGLTDERTEAQKNAEYFGEMDPADPKYAFAPNKASRMTVSEKNEIFKAENELPNIRATESMLREAAKLNPDTLTGYTAGIRASIGSKLPGGVVPDGYEKSAKATNEWQKLMGMEAIKTMANTLKGATTDFELNEFVKLLADPSTPIETRGRIIERMQQLAIVKRKMIRERVNELRGGTFFRPGGGTSDEPMEDEDPLGVGM